jgi:IPT/TIG domain
VNTLRIKSVSPTSGVSGTSVTITGTGFGFAQGMGTVMLGSTGGQLLSWSDKQIVAAVSAAALSGVACVQQNGTWSNAIPFTVPVAGGNTVVPPVLNLVVGETHTIQALGSNGQPVTGLTWTSSDPNVVSLSTDSPPVLTALAAGHVTITAGSGTADVTVSVGALPQGTVVWSNPGNGSGVTKIVPAVPSPTGAADVFAFQGDGTVQAITSDGTTAWTADVSHAMPVSVAGVRSVLPDFQGGLVAFECCDHPTASIVRFDGLTGQRYPAYTPDEGTDLWWGFRYRPDQSLGGMAIHPDGTVFAIEEAVNYPASLYTASVIGIDPTTGTRKFSVPLYHTADTFGLRPKSRTT